jgi:hypothetical protein
MQADEQAIIGNWADGFNGFAELGTSEAGMGIIALNRATQDGQTNAQFAQGTIRGDQFIEALNNSRGNINGVKVTAATATTLDRWLGFGSHHQGTGAGNGGTGYTLTGTDADSITNVILSNITLEGFSAAYAFTNVKGASLAHLYFNDITNVTSSNRPYIFTGCKNIRAVDAYRKTLTTTDATATVVYEHGVMSNGNALHLKVKAIARRSAGPEIEFLERECIAVKEAGTTTIAASKALVEFVTGTGLVIDFAIASDRVRARVTGVAAETWDWTIWIDFEMH